MAYIVKALTSLIIIIALTLSFSTPSSAEYNNSKVYTVIDGVKYYMNGTKIMRNGKVIDDFQRLTYKYGNVTITEKMMKTLLVTDITHNKYKGYPIIYAVGLVFEPKQDKLTSSADFKDQKIKIGYPYLVIMSYNLSKTKSIECYKKVDFLMEGFIKYEELWDAAHDSILDESKDPVDDDFYDTLYNFAARKAHPRIIISKEYSNRAYVLAQDVKNDNVLSDHIKLFRFDTDRTLKSEQKFTPELFATFDWLFERGREFGDYKLRLDRFYIKETEKDHIVIYNFGNEISIALDCDIRIYTKPRLADFYWQYTSNFNLDDVYDGGS